MRIYVVTLIILLNSVSLSSALSFSPNDIEWSTAVSGTLYKDGTLKNGPYMVKAVEFSSPVPGVKNINGNIVPDTEVDPMVFLEIYKDGVLIKETVMYLGSEAYIHSDYEVKVSTTGFLAKNAKEWVFEYYKPWAKVSIQTRAKPKLDVTVTTDKATYTSHSDYIITAKVTVKNNGDGFAKNVDVNLNAGGLDLRGGGTDQLHQNYLRLDKGKSQTYEVALLVPKLIDEKSYNLSADAKWYDVKDLKYNASGSKSVTVSPQQNYFIISKSVSKDRIYLTNSIIVKVVASNGGMYDIYNIHINDSMNEYFEVTSPVSFQHDIALLKPGQEQEFTYSIKPLETNIKGFTLPAATANFTVNNRQYSTKSTAPEVIVNGPKMILNKTADRPTVNITEDVTVTVTITNIGNIATKAAVRDLLPDGVSLVSGLTSLASTQIEPDKPQGFSYIIRMNKEGTFELPAAVANYTGIEYMGITRSSVKSNVLNITVVDPSRIPPPTAGATGSGQPPGSGKNTQKENNDVSLAGETSEPTPTPITPGVSIIYGIIVLILAGIRRR